jgi:hypothetical protein
VTQQHPICLTQDHGYDAVFVMRQLFQGRDSSVEVDHERLQGFFPAGAADTDAAAAACSSAAP